MDETRPQRARRQARKMARLESEAAEKLRIASEASRAVDLAAQSWDASCYPDRGDDDTITLVLFLATYCNIQKKQLLLSLTSRLFKAHENKTITLPKPVKRWKSGQSKYYRVGDLRRNWPSYAEDLPGLPPIAVY